MRGNGIVISFMVGGKFTTIVLSNYSLHSIIKHFKIINVTGRCMKVIFLLFRRSFA